MSTECLLERSKGSFNALVKKSCLTSSYSHVGTTRLSCMKIGLKKLHGLTVLAALKKHKSSDMESRGSTQKQQSLAILRSISKWTLRSPMLSLKSCPTTFSHYFLQSLSLFNVELKHTELAKLPPGYESRRYHWIGKSTDMLPIYRVVPSRSTSSAPDQLNPFFILSVYIQFVLQAFTFSHDTI